MDVGVVNSNFIERHTGAQDFIGHNTKTHPLPLGEWQQDFTLTGSARCSCALPNIGLGIGQHLIGHLRSSRTRSITIGFGPNGVVLHCAHANA
jgi:hypothetical protein